MLVEKKKPDSEESIKDILHSYVKRWFFSSFKELSLPQKLAVMEIHCRKNVLVSAPTGATKTLTAFLSIVNELVDSAAKGILEDRVYAVYVSPLKALNYDIEVNLLEPLKKIEKLAGKSLGIRVAVRTGDTTASERSKMLRKPPHILITTPESLAIVLSTIKFRALLENVSWLIVDEIHALAENKRGTHFSLTMERLQSLSPGLARIGLSATVAPIKEIAGFLVGYSNGKLRDCVVIDVPFIKELDLKVLSPVDDLINSGHEIKHRKLYGLIHKLIQEHRTTLIFTNTRSATERVVSYLKEKYPRHYNENIGAHHSSLSKELRHSLEKRLRKGELKAVVSSTSLELGIDIGYVDLVILLGSPKSVARALQRIGRSGHRLNAKTKGRIIVLDRDDLVECSVLLKSAIEKKIDKVHIPKNALDVLAQQLFGMAVEKRQKLSEAFQLVKQSYCYSSLSYGSFMDVISYLSGEYSQLEDRKVYAKIWYDKEKGEITKRGKMARVIYMTNIGTIPDETYITVKVGSQAIGKIDEAFLERLRRGDVFVLGGEKYEFLYSRGTVAFVSSSVYRPPSIPSWISEMLPLNFDLAMSIGKLRRLIDEKLKMNKPKEEIADFLHSYLYINKKAANAIASYMLEQYSYAEIATDKKLLVEHYFDSSFSRNYYIFHCVYGRRVNDALSRVLAYIASRLLHRDVEINVNDNGFYLASEKKLNIKECIKVLKASSIDELAKLAIERTEVLKRRFRHCAVRSLLVLRSYMGKQKKVGRQQLSSQMLYNAVKQISNDFPIIKEARREVLEDLMDIENARKIVDMLKSGKIKPAFFDSQIASPFAFNIIADSHLDIIKIEEREEFLKRMHQMVLAKIALKKAKQ